MIIGGVAAAGVLLTGRSAQGGGPTTHELKPGFLADIVLVDGNPLENLALLADPAKVQLVMKDGVIYKDCSTPVPYEAALHLAGADFPLREEGVKEAIAAAAH